jgi:P-type conjugative transfer ATPase TrbB
LIEVVKHLLGNVYTLFTDPATVEIIANEDGSVWLDTLTQSSIRTGLYLDPDDRKRIIELMANEMAQVTTTDRPYVSAIFPGTNERFQGQLPPLVSAPTFSIRMPARKVLTLADQLRLGTITQAQLAVLQEALANRRNIMIIGATGSGKSSFANSLLDDAVMLSDRHIIIQDLPELRTRAPNCTTFFTRASNPPITAQFNLFLALRNRPDRIHVGECRDGETLLQLFKAWNTGHPGGLTTLHADSAEDALYRIEDLFGEVTQQTPYRQITRTVGLVVEIRKTPTGRKVTRMISDIRHEPGVGYRFQEVAAA